MVNFQAYGVEIDPIPYNNGISWFESNGYNPKSFLHLIKNNCITPFPDNFFDVIFSSFLFENCSPVLTHTNSSVL